MNKRILLKWFAVIGIVFLAFSLPQVSAKTLAAPPPPKILTGTVPSFVKNGQAHLIGHHPGTDPIGIGVSLAIRNKQEADQVLKEISTPGYPQYRHWLTLEQENQEFNPTPQQEQQVIAWLEANGLKVTYTFPNHLLVDAGGTFAQVEHLLHITLNDYELSGTTFYAPANDPSIDESVSGIVIGVAGISNYPFVQTDNAATYMTSLTNGNAHGLPPYYPQDFANAYDANPLWNQGDTGSGQHIGITLWGTAPSEAALKKFATVTGANVATRKNKRLQIIQVPESPCPGGTCDYATRGGGEAGLMRVLVSSTACS